MVLDPDEVMPTELDQATALTEDEERQEQASEDLKQFFEEPQEAEEDAAAEEDEGEGEGRVSEELLKFFEEEADENDKEEADPGRSPRPSPQKADPGRSPRPSPQKGDGFVDESRYTKDQNQVLVHKWMVGYATRGGGGRAMCRDQDCLERHEQAGVRTIEKGELRIGRRVLIEKEGEDGHMVLMWHHARCIFNVFLRSRKATRTIESPEDLEGFEDIQREDQELLRRIIAGNEDVRGAKFRTSDGSGRPQVTPQKRGVGEAENTPLSKRLKKERTVLRKGDRCWTHCKVRPNLSDRPGDLGEIAVKSTKPELGMLVETEKDGCYIIQFESAEHEKERLEKLKEKKMRFSKGWLRYPRIFEGKKQRIPTGWIAWARPPPRLCSCTKQEWNHSCDCSGIACGRGTQQSVWGVCDQ